MKIMKVYSSFAWPNPHCAAHPVCPDALISQMDTPQMDTPRWLTKENVKRTLRNQKMKTKTEPPHSA